MDPAVAELFGDGAEAIKRYVDILLDRGIVWGLIGPREGERLWERHVLNSVAAVGLLPSGASVVDVGSGAGLPGIPMAVLRPDLSVTLLDSLARRVEFLRLAIEELGLGGRVSVVRSRAEDHPGRYDVVTARAVAPLSKLAPWCAPLMVGDGRIVALKGEGAAAELRDAAPVLGRLRLAGSVHEFEVPVVGGSTWAIELARR